MGNCMNGDSIHRGIQERAGHAGRNAEERGHAGFEAAVDIQVETSCMQWGQWSEAHKGSGEA